MLKLKRYYFHGDETDPGLYYCQFCDLKMPFSHFNGSEVYDPHPMNLDRIKRAYRDKAPKGYYRPARAKNCYL